MEQLTEREQQERGSGISKCGALTTARGRLRLGTHQCPKRTKSRASVDCVFRGKRHTSRVGDDDETHQGEVKREGAGVWMHWSGTVSPRGLRGSALEATLGPRGPDAEAGARWRPRGTAGGRDGRPPRWPRARCGAGSLAVTLPRRAPQGAVKLFGFKTLKSC